MEGLSAINSQVIDFEEIHSFSWFEKELKYQNWTSGGTVNLNKESVNTTSVSVYKWLNQPHNSRGMLTGNTYQ